MSLRTVVSKPKKIGEAFTVGEGWGKIPEKWVTIGVGFPPDGQEKVVLGVGESPEDAKRDAEEKLKGELTSGDLSLDEGGKLAKKPDDALLDAEGKPFTIGKSAVAEDPPAPGEDSKKT